MKQLTLNGITVLSEDELELPFKVQIKASISQGKGSNKQTTNSTTSIQISSKRIDEFVKEYNELVDKFSSKALNADCLVE